MEKRAERQQVAGKRERDDGWREGGEASPWRSCCSSEGRLGRWRREVESTAHVSQSVGLLHGIER